MKKALFLYSLVLLLFFSACDIDSVPSNPIQNDVSSPILTEPTGTASATETSTPADDPSVPPEVTEPLPSETTHSHVFSPANCTKAATCECGATDGDALGHHYSPATCTSPAKCSQCGAVDGNALEHSWIEATCTKEKTCSSCGATTGQPANHAIQSGKCTVCGYADPNYKSEATVWIPTNGGKKYHCKKGCSNMVNPREVIVSEAIDLGFTKCGRCY